MDQVVLQIVGRGEPALLLKLFVVGKVSLGHYPDDFTLLDGHCGIDQSVVGAKRHSDERHKREVGRVFYQQAKCILRVPQQHLLREEIQASVGCDGQFGKSYDLYASVSCTAHQFFYLADVVTAVAHLNMWGSGSHFYKSVVHIVCVECATKIVKSAECCSRFKEK